MLIDYFVKKLFNKNFDENGEIAKKGNIDDKWLSFLLKEPYYSVLPPKTTGRELFNDVYAEKIYKSAPKDKYDLIATITALTAKVITDSYKNFVLPKTSIDEIVLGGGGAYNKTLISYIKNYLPDITVKTHKDFGIPDKLKEAIAFAYLGYFTINKKPNNIPSCTGADCPVIMGKISY
jgi:anhydro-N-acetylmuramic acid kinase